MKKEMPKAYEAAQYEDGIYKIWEQSGFFNPDNLKTEKDVKGYTIVMPPPNVTGTLHMGHAAMLALEDILIRYHRMKGERALWVPGTDHAAIATQTKVEKIIKEEGTNRHEMGREKFLERVKQFAQDSHDTIVNQVKKMGSSCDWSREAYTLDETRTRAVRNVFKMMYDDGLIYRGERIVNWCPRCHSTLADDEVEHKEENAKLYWIKYGPFTLATARPETKLGDTAVAVHPDDKRYKKMVGKKYMIPGVLGEFEIEVVADKAVDPEFGSGAIKVTPAHSFTDNEIAQRHNLPMKKIIDEDGKMMENCGKYAGLTTREARKKIVADMQEMGLIDHIDEDYKHNASVCYRCDTVIEPIPSEQWFIDVNKKVKRLNNKSIKETCLAAVKTGVFKRDRIKIVPERFEKTYFNWMENLRDWCISRQIWYGHQVPVWYKEKETYVGVEAPEGEGWEQDPDTLDTWFSSGLWTFSTLANSPEQIVLKDDKLEINSEDFKNFHPTAVLETGYDIIFFWVARMIIMTTYAVNDIPFQDVYLHGLVLDDKGKKMSKSKGNVIDPLDMVKKYGTDATRLSLVIGSTPGADMKLSEEKIAGFRNFTNKLWNISRYIIKNYGGEEAKLSIGNLASKDDLTSADFWILQKMFILITQVTEDVENYRFSQAGEKLREFTWNDLADWYLEVSKFEKTESKAQILNLILLDVLKLWHPFTPFVTEKIWEEMGKKGLIVQGWPQLRKGFGGQAQDTGFEKIKNIIVSIRNARNENQVEPSKKVKAILVAKDKEFFESQAVLIKSLRTGIEELEITDKDIEQADAINIVVGEVKLYLLGAIDKDKEKKRIEKEITNLEKWIKGAEVKLNNKNFVDNAPKEVVARDQENLKTRKSELESLQERLKTL